MSPSQTVWDFCVKSVRFLASEKREKSDFGLGRQRACPKFKISAKMAATLLLDMYGNDRGDGEHQQHLNIMIERSLKLYDNGLNLSMGLYQLPK